MHRSVHTWVAALLVVLVAAGCAARRERQYQTTTAGAEAPYYEGTEYQTPRQGEPGGMQERQMQEPSPYESMPGEQGGMQPRETPGGYGTSPESGAYPQRNDIRSEALMPGETQPGMSEPGEMMPPGETPTQTGSRPEEQALHSEVHRALMSAPNLDASAISVVVQGDTVYLTGAVPTPEQRRLAHDIAHTVEGVRHVYTRDLAVR